MLPGLLLKQGRQTLLPPSPMHHDVLTNVIAMLRLAGAAKLDDQVAPGQTYTYTWQVPERAGPGPADPSSIVWLYHSHVLEAADPYAGLFGGIVVTRADAANADGTPKDVAR